MNAADRRRVTPALVVLAALLVLVVLLLWAGLGRGVAWRDAAATPPRLPPLAATASQPALPPLMQFRQVWQKPLFSPTRRPEPVTKSEKGASGNLQLTGVIMLPGLAMAIVHDKTTGKDYRVVKGQAVRGAPVLVDLHPRSAVVAVSGSRHRLELLPGASSVAGVIDNAPDADENGRPVPTSAQSAPAASGMVSRRRTSGQGSRTENRSVRGRNPTPGAARARALQVQSKAQRRKAHKGGGG